MPPGKLAAQAGHGFLDSYLNAISARPELCALYRSEGHGTKVVLEAENEQELLAALAQARAADLPHALVVDSGHILPPFFDGSPVVTALGLGPARRAEIQHITRRFRLVGAPARRPRTQDAQESSARAKT